MELVLDNLLNQKNMNLEAGYIFFVQMYPAHLGRGQSNYTGSSELKGSHTFIT